MFIYQSNTGISIYIINLKEFLKKGNCERLNSTSSRLQQYNLDLLEVTINYLIFLNFFDGCK